MRVRIAAVFLALICALPVQAQERVVTRGDSLGLWRDTLDASAPQLRPFVLPHTLTVRLDGAALDSTRYALDARTGRLTLTPPPDASAVLTATYRTLPFESLAQPFTLRDPVVVDTTGRTRLVEREPRTAPPDPVFGDMVGLQRRGAIRRGIIAGNRRDVSLESGLRLELEGEVADGVTLQAVLTDENTPIQPEGTTQRLNDLDRVYIQLDSRRGQARLGDVDLAFTGTTFAPFVRKLQGAAVTAEVPAALDGRLAGGQVTVAGAVTRGIFRTQDIQPIEGVQGPYRLRGQGGEDLIIVIAGSERVYLDGQLLARGEANDYVIDYSTGEISFMPRRLITAERRLTVDFEYTTGSFTRTLLGTEIDLGFGHRSDGTTLGRFRTTILREADGSAFGDELGLTDADLDLIAAAGNAPAFRSGADRVPYDPESPYVLYTRRDTTASGTVQTIYVPAGPADAEVYRVRFSRVEPGQGEYVRAGRAVNGVVFEWVGPGGGNYVPVRLLPKPEARQLVDLAGTIEPVRGLELFGEAAFSGFDRNRLSDLVATSEDGGAYLGGLRLQPTEALGGIVRAEVSGRVREATFRPFSRIRPVEFNRQWNVARAGSGIVGLDSLREAVYEGFAEWTRGEATALRLEGGRLGLGGLFDGTRAAVNLRHAAEGIATLDYRADWIDSRNALLGEEGTWIRQVGRVSRPVTDVLTPFVEVEHERRAQHVLGTDSLAWTALSFWEVRPGLALIGSRLSGGASIGYRDEQLPLAGLFANAARVLTLQAEARYRPGTNFSSEAEAAVRRRDAAAGFRQRGDGDTESVALRWTTRWTPLDRAVELNTVYGASTERAPVLQEVFIRVGPGLGEWVWEDHNRDGIQQLDEFRPQVTPLEGEYIRTFLPGEELRPAAAVQGQVRLRLDPGRLVATSTDGWQGALRHVTSLTTLDLQERTEAPDLMAVYLLRPSILQQPETTLSGRLRAAQELVFFRSEPRYGGRLAGSHLRTMSQLAAGLEGRQVQRLEAEATLQAADPLGLRLRASGERNDSESAFASRTYALRGAELEPEATYRFSDALTVTGGVRVARMRDELAGREATAIIMPLQARVTAAGRLQVFLRAERADVRVSGPPAIGQALFELTQRRGVGTSYLWNASGHYTINRYLRATLNVEGRAPSDAPTIHNVRLQLSALF
jgi:hypothetical protein